MYSLSVSWINNLKKHKKIRYTFKTKPMCLIIYYNSCNFLSLRVQDSVFRLEPLIENGRGKSPYDPKLLTASMLIGELRPTPCAALLGVRARSNKKVEVLKTPSASLFHFSRYIGCKMWITEQDIPVSHYKWICSVVCIYTLGTPHWQDCKLYFNLNIPPLSAGRAWRMTLYWAFFALNPHFWQIKQDYVSIFPLYPQLLPVTLCYITPFNLADGHFPAHHPSSPLPFLSPFSPALLCTPPVLHLCPSLCVTPCVHPSLASLLSPAYCVNVNFTLLMFITSITVCVLQGLDVYLYC